MTIVILLSSLDTTHCEYPVPPSTAAELPAPVLGTGFVINETMYVYGGGLEDTDFSNQFAKLSFDTYGVVYHENVDSNGPKVLFAQSVVFSNNDSVAIIGGDYEEDEPNIRGPIHAHTYSFSQNRWTTLFGLNDSNLVPPNRMEHTAVKAENGLIYIYGGYDSSEGWVQYMDSWSYDPSTGIFKNLTTPPIGLHSSTATALLDGRIVYVGGLYVNDEMEFSDYFLFNQSAVYSPDDDSWELQALNADAINNPEASRARSSAVLGDNFNVHGENDEYYNMLWILDTHTWIWSAPSVGGILPRARSSSSIGRINNEYAVLCFGGAGARFFNDIDVLKFSNMTGNNGGSTTNKELQDLTSPKWVYNITTGATYDEINEEPTSSIILESPKTTYTVSEPIHNDIQLPDIRVCLEGYTIEESPFSDSTYPKLSCTTSNGHSCSNYITVLDLSYHRPKLGGNLDILVHVLNVNETGRIYISFYHPERDPNRNVYFGQHMPLFSDKEIGEWVLEDASRASGNYLQSHEYAYVDYQFERTESLTDSGWNYFGFASQYNSTPQVTTKFQKYGKPSIIDSISGSIILSPASFTTTVHREQKIYSLVNALGLVGGLYGLITAIQAAVFGYRPQSPFGIIHQWSFGHMHAQFIAVSKIALKRIGLQYLCFNCDSSNISNSTKLEPSNERKQFTALNVEENLTQCSSNCQHCIGIMQQQARQIELTQKRTQLLEHIFKAYYVDDEVFQKVDTAIKEPEKSSYEQHSSGSFPHVRPFRNLFQRSRIQTSNNNTTSRDSSAALVSNSSATNSNNLENDVMENNDIKNQHYRIK
ncbi:hypothetical protein BDC45DRAFT_563229 [Circinella umbellata]|nr:hypothetical protein BDC45DRAFT_563229 [Circinella umbellata]